MKSMYDIFKEVGLNELEADVYSYLIHNNKISITEMAKSLGVFRAYIYKSLENLRNINLVDKDNNPADPTHLEFLLSQRQTVLKQKQNSLKKILPEMIGKYNTHSAFSKVKFYQGKDQFVNLFDEILDSNVKTIYSMEDSLTFTNIVSENFIDYWIKKRVQKKIKIKVVFREGHNLLNRLISNSHMELREIKTLPRDFEFNSQFHIYNDNLILWNPVLPQAIRIKDSIISSSFKSLFELTWNGL